MKTSFINNILKSQLILIKFALKLFVCKCLSFQTHLLLDLLFPLTLSSDDCRELRKHQGRKARIYNRPPLDPALLQWAKDFKEIQMQQHGKRQYKMDNLSKE